MGATQVLSGMGMRGWWLQQSQQQQQEVFGEVLAWMAAGILTVPEGKKFELHQAAEAVAHTHLPARGPKPLLVMS